MQDSPPRTSHGEYTRVSPLQIHHIGDKHPPLTPLGLLSSFSSGLGSVGSWTSGRLQGFFSPSFSSYSRSTNAPPSYDSLYNRLASTESQPYDPSVDPIYPYPYPHHPLLSTRPRTQTRRLLLRSRDDRVPREQPARVHLLLRAGIRIPSPHRQHDQHRNHNHNPPLR